MSQRNLDALLTPRSVVVIGAGRNPDSVGRVILRNIARDFPGPIFAVHPEGLPCDGVPSVRRVADLSAPPDLAVIATPAPSVPGLISELGSAGCRAAVVITAGFGEGEDAEGARLRANMLAAAKPYTLRILGPNCLGLVAPHAGLNASFAAQRAIPGRLALLAQSGAVAVTLLDWAKARGVGFSVVATLGDMADIDFGDLLDALAMDQKTDAILMYVEGITSPRKFMSAARDAARLKPVIVVKGGRQSAGAKAAASHTGALMGHDAVYDAAFTRAGLIRVDRLPDLFAIAELLAGAQTPDGDRLAIVTNGGGLGVLAVDALAMSGGRLAELSDTTLAALDRVLPSNWSRNNPVDIIGDADGGRYTAAVETVLSDRNVDAVLVIYCPTAVSDPADAARATIAAAQRVRKPVLTAWTGDSSVAVARAAISSARIPAFASVDDAITAFHQLDTFRKRRRMLMETPSPSPPLDPVAREKVAALLANPSNRVGDWLRGREAKEIAAAYGIPTNSTVFTETPEAAAAAARQIGGRVALKIVSPDIIHKSDVGGVVLDLDGPEAVVIAAHAMRQRVLAFLPAARITGYLVEQMADRRNAHELFLGMSVDPIFGPVIAFGHGGTAVEVIADKTLGLPPLNLDLAQNMIDSTRVGKLLNGYRDRPAADRPAIARSIVGLSALVTDHPSIVDVDVNPLLADHSGVLTVDVRIRIGAQRRADLVIAPYPAQLIQMLHLPDGTELEARPIKPEDEPALRQFVAQLAPEDVRFRFFLPFKLLDHPLAARLTQVDYDREMAFVAAPVNRRDDIWGVVRLHADPDGRRAEYAVTVRSDCKGRGLGAALMTLLLAEAKRRGIDEIRGDVLADNSRMLSLASELGFEKSNVSDDPRIVRTVKRLSRT